MALGCKSAPRGMVIAFTSCHHFLLLHTIPLYSLMLVKIYFNFIYMCMCMCACVCVLVCVQVPTGSIRGHQIPVMLELQVVVSCSGVDVGKQTQALLTTGPYIHPQSLLPLELVFASEVMCMSVDNIIQSSHEGARKYKKFSCPGSLSYSLLTPRMQQRIYSYSQMLRCTELKPWFCRSMFFINEQEPSWSLLLCEH